MEQVGGLYHRLVARSGSGKTAALYDLAGRTGALLVLQEDPKPLMWFDQALTRSGEEA